MRTKKLLILSLGVGAIIQEKQNGKEHEQSQNKFEGKGCPYRTANYRYTVGPSCIEVESPFVAEALIKIVEPDEIVIFGTVKSAWGAFYHRYHKKESEKYEENWRKLEETIGKLGKDSKDEEIDAFQKTINKIYEEDLDIYPDNPDVNKKPNVKVTLIKYGLNNEELQYSYTRIKDTLKDVLKQETDQGEPLPVEISFDITHSFRSLPIYNLVVLNYCRLLVQKEIVISHVFYGNLDAANENRDENNRAIAEIIDLRDIVNVLETTRGISEFLNTGNATTLLDWIKPDDGDVFAGELRTLNEALQMNDRRIIQDSLQELLELEVTDDNHALSDAKVLIQETLKKNISQTGRTGNDDRERQKNKAKFQIDLAQWFLKIGQVGLAASIVKEAMRSFLVGIYEEDTNNFENEASRLRAEQKFNNLARAQEHNNLTPEQQELLLKYIDTESKARKIRNTFAHNLEDNSSESVLYQEAKTTIQKYVDLIKEIMQFNSDCFSTEIITERLRGHITILLTDHTSNEDILQNYNTLLFRDDAKVMALRKARSSNAFSIPRQNPNAVIKDLAKIISIKIQEMLGRCDEGVDVKIIWLDDMNEKLLQNTIPLLKSLIDGSQIHHLKIKNSATERLSLEPIALMCLWGIDTDKEFNEEEKNRLQRFRNLSSYEFVELDNPN